MLGPTNHEVHLPRFLLVAEGRKEVLPELPVTRKDHHRAAGVLPTAWQPTLLACLTRANSDAPQAYMPASRAGLCVPKGGALMACLDDDHWWPCPMEAGELGGEAGGRPGVVAHPR